MIIDFHCHIGKGVRKSLKPGDLIKKMDDCGVDKAVVCPVEEGITVYNAEANQYILDAVNEFPDRLVGFGSFNPWFGRQALDMAGKFLGEGLRGLKFHPNLQGFMINDEIVYPLMEIAGEHHALVYTHCGTPVYSLPFQILDLAGRFSDVPIIMGHMGFNYEYMADTIKVSGMADNLFLETSLTASALALFDDFLKMAVGLDSGKVLFGSDSPASDMAIELDKLRSLDISDEDMDKILGRNAEQLLGEV